MYKVIAYHHGGEREICGSYQNLTQAESRKQDVEEWYSMLEARSRSNGSNLNKILHIAQIKSMSLCNMEKNFFVHNAHSRFSV